jgi:outer membrane protein TolC
MRAWPWTAGLTMTGVVSFLGCATQSPLSISERIQNPLPTPAAVVPPVATALPAQPDPTPDPKKPEPPKNRGEAPLALAEVLRSVQTYFPLILAIEQERGIAEGARLSAEGQFDPVLKANAIEQTGNFGNTRAALGLEQATPYAGISTFGGWRFGNGNFPIYAGDRKTGQGGEWRAGVNVPLLQNREIDPRRARLRAAEISAQLADPVIRRAQLDFYRLAGQAYWSWQAAGAQYRVAEYLLKLARDRQAFLDQSRALGNVGEAVPILNRRLIANREETLLNTERQLQQAAIRLSLYLRDSEGNPVIPSPSWLNNQFLDLQPPSPNAQELQADIALAWNQRPELVRIQLEKERRTVDLKLAGNQLLPQLNGYAVVSQDVGFAKKTLTGTGPFTTDRTNAEVGATLEFPLPFRNARGLVLTAQSQLNQLLAQERFLRDDIATQVQDAVSELLLTYSRLAKAREELKNAERVLEIETETFKAQRIGLVELNLQEVAAAEGRAKVVNLLGAYYSAVANYLAVIGAAFPEGTAGKVLPNPEKK